MTQIHTPAAERYTGLAHALRHIYTNEGAAALLSGLGPRVLWIGIGGAVFIGSYEEYKRRVGAALEPDG